MIRHREKPKSVKKEKGRKQKGDNSPRKYHRRIFMCERDGPYGNILTGNISAFDVMPAIMKEMQ